MVFSGWRGPDDYVRIDDPRVNIGALVAAGYRPYVYDGIGGAMIIWSTSSDAVTGYTLRKAVPIRIPNGMIIKPPSVILIDEQDGGFINKIA